MLMLLCLLLSTTAQADQLFDFQMKLAQKGNAEAQFKVGEMYETGFGVEQDMVQAENWIQMAARQGHETAGFKLLYWDLEKNGLNDSNRAQLDALRQKANAGNEQAQYYVGKMYAHGVGVKQDTDKAVDWLSKATLVGVLAAERELSAVKEQKQRIAIESRREQERQAELKRQQQRQAELEKQRAEEQARARAREQAMEKARAEEAARKRAAEHAAEQAASRQTAEQAAARQAAEQEAARKAAQERRLAAQQKARNEQKQARNNDDHTFEADPCKGKSARFLSTCR
jgi:TPR repeat protein